MKHIFCERTQTTNLLLALVAIDVVFAFALACIHAEESSAIASVSLIGYRVLGSEQILLEWNVSSLENYLAISIQNTKFDANHTFDKTTLIPRR